jgi:chromosome partitioning protein
VGLIYTLSQQKGGVGKTALALNLAVALAREGYKVLAVDCDSQASLTLSLGVNPLELGVTMFELMTDPKIKAETVIVPTHEAGVDLVPSHLTLAVVEMSMREAVGRERVLRRKLEPIRDQYDYILIDCGPTLGITTLNALGAADKVIVVVQPEPLCIFGIEQLFDTVRLVRENSNANLEVAGLVISMYDARLKGHRDIVEQLQAQAGGQVPIFQTFIRRRSSIIESTANGVSVVSSKPNSDLALDYTNLAKEIAAYAPVSHS